MAFAAGSMLFAQAPQAAPPRARLSVEAPAGCATEASLIARVHARVPAIEFADDGAETPRLRVSIDAKEARAVRAELVIDWPDGRRSERRLRAQSCDAVADALSLLIAWTLDPSAVRAPDDELAHGTAAPLEQADAGAGTDVLRPSPAPGSRPAQAAETTEPARPPPSPASPPAQPGVPPAGPGGAAAARSASPAESPFALVQLSVGASAQLIAGPAPDPMPGVGLVMLAELRGSGWFLPALRASASHAWLNGVAERFGSADFALDAARLDACPFGLRVRGLGAYACLSAALGSLSARGTHTYEPESRARLWASLGGGVLLGAHLMGPLALEAGARLERPLRRDRFAFAPEEFHRVAGLCFDAQLALAVRFP